MVVRWRALHHQTLPALPLSLPIRAGYWSIFSITYLYQYKMIDIRCIIWYFYFLQNYTYLPLVDLATITIIRLWCMIVASIGSLQTETTTTHVIKTKKSVRNCALWLALTQNYCKFLTCEWIFCWNIQCLTIYIGDRYLFRYGHVWFDTNINPQVQVFDINREPVLAPTTHTSLFHNTTPIWFQQPSSTTISLSYPNPI